LLTKEFAMATATPAQTATLQAQLPGDWSLEDLQLHLGGVPLHRIRMFPPPGYATEADVLDIEAREDRLYEFFYWLGPLARR